MECMTNEMEKKRKIEDEENIVSKEQEKRERYRAQTELEAKTNVEIDPNDIFNQLEKLYPQMRKYIKQILNEWESSLPGKSDFATQSKLLHETKRDLVKLLYQLRSTDNKKKQLSSDIFSSLSTTLYYVQQKDFLKANESYMKLSIGNAAWPIGVVSVGIHQRSGDDRIQNKSANVMIDDSTRRWITGIKRLITFSERSGSSTT